MARQNEQSEQRAADAPVSLAELKKEIPWGFLRSYSRTIEEQLLARFQRYFHYDRSRLGLLWLLCEYPGEHQRVHNALHGVLDGSWIAREIGELDLAVQAFIHLWGFRFRDGAFEHLEVREQRVLDRPMATLLLPSGHPSYAEISPGTTIAETLAIQRLSGRADVDAAVYQYVQEQGIALDHKPVFQFVDEWTDSTLEIEITRLISWVDDYFDKRIWTLPLWDVAPEREKELTRLSEVLTVHPHELSLNNFPRTGGELAALPGVGTRTLQRLARMLAKLVEHWRGLVLGLEPEPGAPCEQSWRDESLHAALMAQAAWVSHVPENDELGYVKPERDDEPTYQERLLHQHRKGIRKTFNTERGLDPAMAFLKCTTGRERKDLVALMDEALDREKKERWWLRRYVEVRHALEWYGFDHHGQVAGWDESELTTRPIAHLLLAPEHPIHDVLSPMSPVSAVKTAAVSLPEREQEALRDAIRVLGQEQRAVVWGRETGRLQTDRLTPAVSRDLFTTCRQLVTLLFHDDFAHIPLMELTDLDRRALVRPAELVQRSPETIRLADFPANGEDLLAWPGIGGGTVEKLVRGLVDAMTHWRARISGQRQVERREASHDLSAGLSELDELSRLL